MGLIDCQCINSLYFTNNLQDHLDKKIYIGTRDIYIYWSYLYFDLQEIPQDIYLKAATIVLFKNPCALPKINKQWHDQEACKKNSYTGIPTLDYLSEYTYYYKAPRLKKELAVDFTVEEDLAYTEIDITSIVKAWLNEEIENRGIILVGSKNSRFIVYESIFNTDKGIRPFLRVKYEKVHGLYPYVHEPIVELPVEVKIMS